MKCEAHNQKLKKSMVAMEYNLYKFCLQIMIIIVYISLLALQIYPKHSIKNAKKI